MVKKREVGGSLGLSGIDDDTDRLLDDTGGVPGGGLYDDEDPILISQTQFINSPAATFISAASKIANPPTTQDIKSGNTTYQPGQGAAFPAMSPTSTMASPGRAPPLASSPGPKSRCPRTQGVRLPPLPKNEPHSLTLQFAHTLTSDVLFHAIPRRGNPHDAIIYESKGASFVDAARAMFGTHRPASERLYWTLPKEHNIKVKSLFEWVDQMAWALANFGLQKFLTTKTRGALVSNANYISQAHPTEPMFDWITFEQAQKTHDRTLQESIATYDPATTTLIFVFLVSTSYNSMAIWRRKLTIPPSIQLRLNLRIESVKAELRKKTNIIKVKSPALRTSPPPRPIAPPIMRTKYIPAPTPPPLPSPIVLPPVVKTVVIKEPASHDVITIPAPMPPPEKKKKKVKWWQIWKKIHWGSGN